MGIISELTLYIRMLFKKIFQKKDGDDQRGFDLESIVGEKCVVVERIDSFAGCGLVKVKGTQWAARGSYDDDVFEIGSVLKVVAIEGVRLICKK